MSVVVKIRVDLNGLPAFSSEAVVSDQILIDEADDMGPPDVIRASVRQALIVATDLPPFDESSTVHRALISGDPEDSIAMDSWWRLFKHVPDDVKAALAVGSLAAIHEVCAAIQESLAAETDP